MNAALGGCAALSPASSASPKLAGLVKPQTPPAWRVRATSCGPLASLTAVASSAASRRSLPRGLRRRKSGSHLPSFDASPSCRAADSRHSDANSLRNTASGRDGLPEVVTKVTGRAPRVERPTFSPDDLSPLRRVTR